MSKSEVTGDPWRLDTWFPDLGPEILGKLRIYDEELHKFNKTLSLVSSKTLALSDILHFSDAILASRVIMKSNPNITEVHDFGTGNGFPGLVLAILFPKVKVNIVETDIRKCEFMKHVINATGASNAQVLNSKIDDIKEGTVKVGVTRGLSTISKTILVTRKCIPKGGILYHLKGEQWSLEVSEIPIQLCSLWTPGLVGEYRLPSLESKFSVIKTDKIG